MGMVLLFGIAAVSDSFAAEDRMRAKIGIKIKSKGKTARAKKREFLRKGDQYRVYVNPEKGGYIYVIRANGSSAELLNITRQKIVDGMLFLPSKETSYKVDGKSPKIFLTVVCSPVRLAELSKMILSEFTHGEWAALEKDLIRNSEIVLTRQKDGHTFEIAGNVREIVQTDPFVKDLPVFSGKGILVKKYEFQVKK